MIDDRCLLLLSGGQDTATCLAWGRTKFEEVYAITFDFGQRHRLELKYAKWLAKAANCEKHEILNISDLYEITRHTTGKRVIPTRNMIFLSIGCAYALAHNIHHLVAGMGQVDYSNYPDCRDSSVKAVQVALQLNCDTPVVIHTPLMWESKANTIRLMRELGHLDWYEFTHTCYNNSRPPCGHCDACVLRENGFAEVGIRDPIYNNILDNYS